MKSNRLYWLSPINRGGYQFFREWLTEAWESDGGRVMRDLRIPWFIKMLVGKIGMVAPLCLKRPKRRLIICAGGRVDYYAWPWCYAYEIVPVVWDCWPKYWPKMIEFVRRNRTRVLFCTSSQTAKHVQQECPDVKAVWIPEGIRVRSYIMGSNLVSRPIDILEMGRQYKPVHQAIIEHSFKRPIKHLYQEGGKLLFKDFSEMTCGLRDSKIAICYPRCDTHPEMAGDIETLTQRYWECMLSGTLIAGRAPKELIDFCGYNPVVTLGERPAEQLEELLANIDSYQPLVCKNRAFAVQHAGWDKRIHIIKEALGN